MRISSPLTSIKTFAFLDDGSTVTLIDKSLACHLGLKGQSLRITLQGIGGTKTIDAQSEKVDFQINDANDDFENYKVKNAITITNLKLLVQSISGAFVHTVAKMTSIFIQSYDKAEPKILIGQDN